MQISIMQTLYFGYVLHCLPISRPKPPITGAIYLASKLSRTFRLLALYYNSTLVSHALLPFCSTLEINIGHSGLWRPVYHLDTLDNVCERPSAQIRAFAQLLF